MEKHELSVSDQLSSESERSGSGGPAVVLIGDDEATTTFSGNGRLTGEPPMVDVNLNGGSGGTRQDPFLRDKSPGGYGGVDSRGVGEKNVKPNFDRSISANGSVVSFHDINYTVTVKENRKTVTKSILNNIKGDHGRQTSISEKTI